jgi:hypothetical protein
MRPRRPSLALICAGALAGTVRCVPLANDAPLSDSGRLDAHDGDAANDDSDASPSMGDSGPGPGAQSGFMVFAGT